MTLLNERQKTKVIFETDFETIDIDCFVKNFTTKTIILSILPNEKNSFEEISDKQAVVIKIFTTKGILIFNTLVTKKNSASEIIVANNETSGRLEDIRSTPRYEANCPITIFRPLQCNLEGRLIDISVRGLRFYSESPLNINSEYEIMLNLSDSVGKIILTGKVLDKNGLPEGTHRMVIEKISNSDRQKLVDFCMSLAK